MYRIGFYLTSPPPKGNDGKRISLVFRAPAKTREKYILLKYILFLLLCPLCFFAFLDLGKYSLQENKEAQQDGGNDIGPGTYQLAVGFYQG